MMARLIQIAEQFHQIDLEAGDPTRLASTAAHGLRHAMPPVAQERQLDLA